MCVVGKHTGVWTHRLERAPYTAHTNLSTGMCCWESAAERSFCQLLVPKNGQTLLSLTYGSLFNPRFNQKSKFQLRHFLSLHVRINILHNKTQNFSTGSYLEPIWSEDFNVNVSLSIKSSTSS